MLTNCIQNYDHNQNYVNANHAHNQIHARSQNNVAGKKLEVLCDQREHIRSPELARACAYQVLVKIGFTHWVRYFQLLFLAPMRRRKKRSILKFSNFQTPGVI